MTTPLITRMAEQDKQFAKDFGDYVKTLAYETVGIAFVNPHHASKIAVAVDKLLDRFGAPETDATRLGDELKEAAAGVPETAIDLLINQYPEQEVVFRNGAMSFALQLSLGADDLDEAIGKEVARELLAWISDDLGHAQYTAEHQDDGPEAEAS